MRSAAEHGSAAPRPVSTSGADFSDSRIVSVQDIFDFLTTYFADCP